MEDLDGKQPLLDTQIGNEATENCTKVALVPPFLEAAQNQAIPHTPRNADNLSICAAP